MQPSTALFQLKNFPQTFLRNNFLTIPGGRDLSGSMQCYIGTNTGGQRTPTLNESFKISFNAVNVGEDAFPIPTYVQYIRMIPTSESMELWELPPYDLNSNPGDLMITSQLSACAFCVLQVGGSTLVAHVQPGNIRGNREEMRIRLQKLGRFRGHDNQRLSVVYGSKEYSNRCNIVGIRSGGIWGFYAQNWDGSALAPIITAVNKFL